MEKDSFIEALSRLNLLETLEIHFDDMTRCVYSVDASIVEVKPDVVFLPRTIAELEAVVRICHTFYIPMTARGAATGIAGGCLGSGVVIDLSKYLKGVKEINIAEEYAICEPGVIQDDLNAALSSFNYRLGPDTSTGNRATLGGMVGNNAAGARSLRFGRMSDALLDVELMLANGERLSFTSLSERAWQEKLKLNTQEGEIYRTLQRIRDDYADEIALKFPPIPRRVSGYALDELIKPFPLNVAKIIAGSEGTLGIATEVKVRIVPKPKKSALLLFFFDDLFEAFRAAPALLAHHPLSLELIDEKIIALGHKSPSMRGKLEWLKQVPEALLIVECDGETDESVREKIMTIEREHYSKSCFSVLSLFDEKEIANVWHLRKSGLGLLLSKRSYSRAVAFIEDLSIPPHALASFMELFLPLLAKYHKEAGIYGHVGAGCMHIRPWVDLRDANEVMLTQTMMKEVAEMVASKGGALSGEHGDGWIRSWLNPTLFGDKIMEAFCLLKDAFDPLGIMNRGKIVQAVAPWDTLRAKSEGGVEPISTFLDFSQEGGFELAADLCNGNGLCRKKEQLMCPSFQATQDEFHSTRARAQALRSIIHGRLPKEAWTGERMYDVLDLCLSCKGCKTECPSQVDMAKFKSEFLYHYQQEHGSTFRNRAFAHIGPLSRALFPFRSIFNAVSGTGWAKKAMGWIGLSPTRTLPRFAKHRFSTLYSQYAQPKELPRRLLLMNDTFTEFYHPEIGLAALKLLNALGWSVILLPWSCCGRPALSKGFLPLARRQAEALTQLIHTHLKDDIPFIGLEPSCLLTVKDDYSSLLSKNFPSISCTTLDEFLALEIPKATHLFQDTPQKIAVHGHCYQKALVRMHPTLTALRAIPSFIVEEIPSGCCGMAGSFGYEIEHDPISRKIAELTLLPTLRLLSDDTWIVASGTSCRQQILDGSNRRSLHLAEALVCALR